MAPVTQTDLQDYLPLVASGKVRELYELDQSTLLFVATDRISGMGQSHWELILFTYLSAYDVIMKNVRRFSILLLHCDMAK